METEHSSGSVIGNTPVSRCTNRVSTFFFKDFLACQLFRAKVKNHQCFHLSFSPPLALNMQSAYYHGQLFNLLTFCPVLVMHKCIFVMSY